MKRIYWIICFIGVLSITGCGRVSAPKSPDNAFYPHTYFIKEKSVSENKTSEPIDEELKDTGMIIEKIY